MTLSVEEITEAEEESIGATHTGKEDEKEDEAEAAIKAEEDDEEECKGEGKGWAMGSSAGHDTTGRGLADPDDGNRIIFSDAREGRNLTSRPPA